ncbi:MAG: hypothetical protein E7317_03420 [Clostridiales bacterium]|nr:hypothetical protein [Clostridiales bacterium]
MDADTLSFFDGHAGALPLYACFEKKLYALFPDVRRRVQKTQITFSNRHVFCCVSFARVRRKAELPDPYLVVTLGLAYGPESDRVAAATEPYPGRWTVHIVLGGTEDIDDGLIEWIRQAYAFANAK